MIDLVRQILEVVDLIGSPVTKYLNYHRKFNKYVDDLKQAKADLRDREADIRQQLQEENRFGRKPKREVESWFSKVEEKNSLAQVVEKNVNEKKYLFRSSLAKLVDETTQEIKKVHDEGHFPAGLVVIDPLAAKVELPTEELVGSTPAEEIYEYMMGDEVGKIGVWGMGGIGKTTIVKNVYNKLLEETKFSKLIWTTVSQDFDMRRLQKVIASQMKENLSDDDDTTIRAANLSAMLRKQGRYVLILDDVWTSFPLNDVGIPEPEDNGSKLILTTRCEDVVRSMGCKQVQVKCLAEHEALQLFLRKVGQDKVHNPKIKSTMKLIVKECSGLPLAIVTVAGSMKGISDPYRWINALSELQGHINNIHVSEDKVFGCLKFSYVYLEPKLRTCFLYCALYPEDYEIPKGEIIEHWLEEGLIDQMGTRKAIHNRVHVFLQRLEESCLLERVRDGEHIKMHDLVRDMALHITEESPRFFVRAGLQLIELSNEQYLTEDLEKVSFMRSYIHTIPSDLFSSRYLKLTSLLLAHNSLENIPHSFFDHMPNLMVLDLSWNMIESLPHSVSNLVNLTALLLAHCSHMETVPSLAKLIALRKLDLQFTGINEIPQGLEALINLRYLNLGRTFHLKQIPSGIFFKLVHLQHLVLFPASLREEEIRELKKLEVLVGHFTDVHGLIMYFSNKKFPNEYFIVASPYADLFWYYDDLEQIRCYSEVENTKRIVFYEVDINVEDAISTPSDIQKLELRKCSKVKSADDIVGLKYATDLRECKVATCDDFEYLFSSWCAPLQTLESLNLRLLKNLKKLVAETGPPPHGSFSSLKKIDLSQVNGVQKLLSTTSDLQDLCNLEELKLYYCYDMEEIIASEEEKEGEQGKFDTNSSIKFVLPKLRILELCDLQNLKSICSRNVIMVCDSLEEIEIIRCTKLERIPLYFSSLDNTQPSIPPSLKIFHIDPADMDWWKRVEWSVHPNAMNVLMPIITYEKHYWEYW